MFERILIPLDGSPRAELALGQVGRILRREDSEVILLRVIDLAEAIRTMDPALRVDTAYLREHERTEAQKYLHDVARRFSDQGMKVHARIAEGPPAETILEQANQEGATLIVMTTHGRTGIFRWLIGSIAEKVVRASPLPLVLIRSFRSTPKGDLEPVTAEEYPFRKILVPTDGSPAADAAVTPAEKFAHLCNSEIIVLHAQTPVIYPGEGAGVLPMELPLGPRASEDDPLTVRAAERFRDSGLKVTRLTVLGDPAAQIIDQSHAPGIDLIAMSTHGRSGLSRWVMGSVTERVLRHADVPLLLIRSEQDRGAAKKERASRTQGVLPTKR